MSQRCGWNRPEALSRARPGGLLNGVACGGLAFLTERSMLSANYMNSGKGTPQTLCANGLLVPSDFPAAPYEAIYVLIHRTAPGRRIYVSIGGDDALPTEWKLNSVPLDESALSEMEHSSVIRRTCCSHIDLRNG